jgi:CRISPR-associated endoribonuclease Cas6
MTKLMLETAMLVSVVFVITPRVRAALPPTLGHVVHACFLNLVAREDAALAAQLHEDDREKPFTVSPLQGALTTDSEGMWVEPDKTYWLRFTSIDAILSQWLLTLDTASVGQLVLCNTEFLVRQICVRPEEHRWAAQTTYEELYRQWLLRDAPLPRKLPLRFFSPTTFRLGRQNLPFPLPRLVFLTLAEKWNRYAPVHLGTDVATTITDLIRLARYQLHTRVLHFGRYKQVGFVGACEFLLDAAAETEHCQMVPLLAAFGFYAGIGYKTTMGMGQMRWVEAGQEGARQARDIRAPRQSTVRASTRIPYAE